MCSKGLRLSKELAVKRVALSQFSLCGSDPSRAMGQALWNLVSEISGRRPEL